jgi:hypothetical protein
MYVRYRPFPTMNVPLFAAGSVAVLAAAIHGIAGDLLVVRKLSTEALPRTRLGGERMTKAMIHVAWHLTTFAFFAVGCALVLAATALDGDAARALGFAGAGAATGFAVLVVAFGAAYNRSGRSSRHPGPWVLTAAAALAWWGVLSL